MSSVEVFSAERRKVSLVAPVYNEEINIPPFYDAWKKVVANISSVDWELLFVDDGSKDKSPELLRGLCAADPRVKLLQLSRNFGSLPALTAGLAHACGDAAITMSVDLQDPPELIQTFVAQWQKGNQIVWGVRRSRKDPAMKSLLANAFYWICRKVAVPDFPRGGMDCGLFDRCVIREHLQSNERNAYIFASLFLLGFRQVQIPYDRQPRLRGSSGWPLAKRLKVAIDIFVSYSYFPIRFMQWIGGIVTVASLVYAAYLVIGKIFYGVGGPGWPSLMVAILFLGGVQLIMLGVLGEYIWRSSEQVRGRPLYVVMEKIGFDSKAMVGERS